MDQLDVYVRDLLFNNCRVNHYIFLERDFETERQIELAGKIEYILRTDKSAVFKIFHKDPYETTNKKDFKPNSTVFSYYAEIGCIRYKSKERGTIFELLGIEAVGRNYDTLDKLSGIYIYSNTHNTSFDETIAFLGKTLNVEHDSVVLSQEYVLNETVLDMTQVFKKYNSYLFRSGACYWAEIFICLLNGKKIQIPQFNCNSKWHHFFPYGARLLLLFNQYALENNPYSVILTDSLEIAKANQTYLDREGIKDIAFLSWYGGDEHIEDFDWSQLTGRRVYFLVTNHSGNEFDLENLSPYNPNWNEHFQTLFTTATKLRNKLYEVANVDFRVIFCELNSGIGYKYLDFAKFNSFPFVCRLEDLQANILNRQCLNTIQTFEQFKKGLEVPPTKRKLLMAPLFYAHSATLIYGRKNTGKTMFALNLALSLAMGKNPIAGWKCIKEPVKVLHFYRDPGFLQKFKKSLASIENRGRSVQPNAAFDFTCIDCSRAEGDLLDFILKRAEAVDMAGANKIIFIDVPLHGYLEITKSKNDLVEDLKMQGWAVVIVQDETEYQNLYNEYKVDSGMKIEEINTGSINRLKQSVSIRSKLKLPQAVKRRFCCIFDFSDEYPRFWKERTIKDSSKFLDKKARDIYKLRVGQLVREKYTGPQIAKQLKLSLSMVKKLKGELGLSKPRNPQRA